MRLDQIKQLLTAPSENVLFAQKLQKTVEKLSYRELPDKVKVEILGDYEDKAASELKKELSRNWAYPVYEIVTNALRQWTDQNKTIAEEDVNNEFKETIKTIYNGQSLEFYINNVFGKSLFNRFQDFIVVEKTAENPKPIIFNVPIHNVYHYSVEGYKVNHLLYLYEKRIDKDKKEIEVFYYYGLLEDGFYFVKFYKKGEDITNEDPVRIERDKDNPVNELPVRQVGSLLYKEDSFDIKESRIAVVIDKLESYRRLYDIHEISKVIHAFPEKVTISIDCPNCAGAKKVENREGDYVTCPTCGGSGKWVAKSPNQITYVPTTLGPEESIGIPEVVKYVQKDISTLEFQAKALKELRTEIISDATGLTTEAASGMKTATEIVENKVPLNSKLNSIIDSDIEPTYVWLLAQINNIWYGSSKYVPSVKYNRFYTGLSSNSIMSELEQINNNNLSPAIKREAEIDYINSVYADDPERAAKTILEIESKYNTQTQNNEESNLSKIQS